MTQPAFAMNQPTFAEMYERWLVKPLFQPWVDVLLERVQLAAGDRVLDLACGTGIAARGAKERLGETGRVVGVDLSPMMLTVARAINPSIDWREGNATVLPFEAETFDVILCQQGLQFFPDKPAAAHEMRRVLAPNGRVAVATWRSLDESPAFLALHRVAERHLGPITDPRHGFGDGAALEKLLADAGFHDVRVETMSRSVVFADPGAFVRLNSMALVGMSPDAKSKSDEERARLVDAIAADSADVLPAFADGTGIRFPVSTNVATAKG